MNNVAKSLAKSCASLSKSGARFASITYTAKESGDVARFTLLLGANYGRLIQASLAIVAKKKVTGEIPLQAKKEVLESLVQSLVSFETESKNPDYTCADTYEGVTVGVKCHKEEGTVYLSGVVVSKKVITPGVFKAVNSKPLTIAKNALKKGTAMTKWRQFIVRPENVDTIKIGGKELRFAS